MERRYWLFLLMALLVASCSLFIACPVVEEDDDDDDNQGDNNPSPPGDDDSGGDDDTGGASCPPEKPIECYEGGTLAGCCSSDYPVCCLDEGVCCKNGYHCCSSGCCKDSTGDDDDDDDEPDLYVDGFSFYVEHCWETGYIDFDYIRVCNQGDGDAGSVYMAIHIRDESLWGWRVPTGFTTGSIDAGECHTSYDLNFDIDFTGNPDGWYYIWVQVDEFDDEDESNESNNYNKSADDYYFEDC